MRNFPRYGILFENNNSVLLDEIIMKCCTIPIVNVELYRVVIMFPPVTLGKRIIVDYRYSRVAILSSHLTITSCVLRNFRLLILAVTYQIRKEKG